MPLENVSGQRFGTKLKTFGKTWVHTVCRETFQQATKATFDVIGTLRLNIVSHRINKKKFEPVHEISNNVVCATSKGSDQPAHTRRLIRAFACRLSIL